MDLRNQTMVTEFILLGFAGGPGLKISLFITVLLTYMVTLVGNIAMIVIIWRNHRLHSPMYFFLWNLAILETFNISNVIPLMLVQMFSVNKSISMANCFTQSFFYFYLATSDFFLLAIMSYDRYVAICYPLRYASIMNGRLCVQLAVGSWLGSLLVVLCPTIVITRFPFCGPNLINHFFCDSSALVTMACTDTGIIQIINLITGLIVVPSSLWLTAVSYVYIISTVLRIPSVNRRQKAFSTCGSHLTMVTLVYGSALFIEVSPALNPSKEVYKIVSLVSSITPPLLNPFIYTFRNEKVKEVLKEIVHRESL